MDIKHILQSKLLEIIQKWEQINDPEVTLDFSVFYDNFILPELIVNQDLRYTLVLDVPYIPNNVLYLIDCPFTILPTKLPQLKRLTLSKYPYIDKYIPEFPDSLEVLNICGLFTPIKKLPNKIRVLNYINSDVFELPSLPPTLEILTCRYLRLQKLPTLPLLLKELDVSNNELCKLPELPHSLEKINTSYNMLVTLPELPNSLVNLHVGDNALIQLPNLPCKLETLNIEQNCISTLPDLPPSLRLIIFNDNKFQSNPIITSETSEIEYIGGQFGYRSLLEKK